MKYIYKLFILLSIISCSDNLEELNENIKNPDVITGDALFTSGQKNLVDQMINSSVNTNIFRLFAQYWTETVYTDETRYEIVNRSIPGNNWRILYRDVIKNLSEAKKSLEGTVTPSESEKKQNDNKIAITEIHLVYAYSVLVETYGNVPYSEAIDSSNKLPKYDDALTIYLDLFKRLDTALNTIDTNFDSFGSHDNIYSGDNAQWIKFGNSLKLRMGVMLSYAPGQFDTAKTFVTEASENLFTSNSDNALMTYLKSVPNANQIYVDLVASGRNDFVPANTIIDVMNELEDPRRKFYFDNNITDDTTEEVVYVGGIYGSRNGYSSYTHVNTTILEPDYPGTLLDYAEVEFLLAEAAERNLLTTTTAAVHYNNAVSASILDWGGSQVEADLYLANPEVAYTNLSKGWEEKIGVQAWIGLYNRGYEAWTSYRRLDYPQLEAPEEAISSLPVRFTYPVTEQTLNSASYQAAASAIGGDNVETKLFWDQN